MSRIVDGWQMRGALLIFALAVGTPARAATVSLSLTVHEQSQHWSAYLVIVDPSSETLGLAGIEFDVIGSGGISVTSSFNQLPQPTETTDSVTFFQKGFTLLRSDGVAGEDIRAAQGLFNTLSPTGTGNNNLLEGLGKSAILELNGSLPATAIGFPLLIASGTYSGGTGLLQIIGSPANTTLLPASLPALNGFVTTFSPELVVNGQVALAPVPEPTAIFLAVKGLCLLAGTSRRRRP